MKSNDKVVEELKSNIEDYKRDGIERSNFEIKGKDAGITTPTKQLVSMANTKNTHVYMIIGIEEADESEDYISVQNISKRDGYINNLSNNIVDKVNPNPQFNIIPFEYNSNKLIAIYIFSNEHILYSFETSNDKIVFPYRNINGTVYLNGRQVKKFYKTGYLPNTHNFKERVELSLENTTWQEPIKMKKDSNKLDHNLPLKTKIPTSGYMMQKRLSNRQLDSIEDILKRIDNLYKDTKRGTALEKNGTFSISQPGMEWIGTGDYSEYFNTVKNFFKFKDKPTQSTRYISTAFIEQFFLHNNTEVNIIVNLFINNNDKEVSFKKGKIFILFNKKPINSRQITSFSKRSGLQFETWNSYELESKIQHRPFKNSYIKCEDIFIETETDACHFVTKNSILEQIKTDKLLCHSPKTLWKQNQLHKPPIHADITTKETYNLNIPLLSQIKPYRVGIRVRSSSVIAEN